MRAKLEDSLLAEKRKLIRIRCRTPYGPQLAPVKTPLTKWAMISGGWIERLRDCMDVELLRLRAEIQEIAPATTLAPACVLLIAPTLIIQ